MASTITPHLVIAVLAPGKGRGLEKDTQLDGPAKPGRGPQHASLHSIGNNRSQLPGIALGAGEMV